MMNNAVNLKVIFLSALALILGACQTAPAPTHPVQTDPPPYLMEADGAVSLRLSVLLQQGMAVQLKRGGETDAEEEKADDGVLLNGEQARAFFAAVDAVSYGTSPKPMPTGAKGYLWAVRVSEGSTDAPLLFFFLDMETRATLVVLTDGAQRSFSMTQEQGKALDKAFSDIAAQAGMPAPH